MLMQKQSKAKQTIEVLFDKPLKRIEHQQKQPTELTARKMSKGRLSVGGGCTKSNRRCQVNWKSLFIIRFTFRNLIPVWRLNKLFADNRISSDNKKVRLYHSVNGLAQRRARGKHHYTNYSSIIEMHSIESIITSYPLSQPSTFQPSNPQPLVQHFQRTWKLVTYLLNSDRNDNNSNNNRNSRTWESVIMGCARLEDTHE